MTARAASAGIAGSAAARWGSVAALAVALGGAVLAAGCIPVVIGAAAGGAALVATDRRTAGAQMNDEEIEFKFGNEIANRYGDRVHAIATAYNGTVMLTGQVPDDATREAIEGVARGLPNVRDVQNELAVGPGTTLAERTRDTTTTSLVKARLLDDSRVPGTRIKVVTERDTVYLMGIVTRQEGQAAAEVASTSPNVARVVKVFEYTD